MALWKLLPSGWSCTTGSEIGNPRNEAGRSDAYATGLSLFALVESASIGPEDAAYVNGRDFLLRHAKQDGSWHVESRSFKFQPYFESGFPHGDDQWISAAATGWATLALLKELRPRSN